MGALRPSRPSADPAPRQKWGVVDLRPGPCVSLKHLPHVTSAGHGWRGVVGGQCKTSSLLFVGPHVPGSALSSLPSVPQCPAGASPATVPGDSKAQRSLGLWAPAGGLARGHAALSTSPCLAGCDGRHLLRSEQNPSGSAAGAGAVVQPGPAQGHEATHVHEAVAAAGPATALAHGRQPDGQSRCRCSDHGRPRAVRVFPFGREETHGDLPTPRSASLATSFPSKAGQTPTTASCHPAASGFPLTRRALHLPGCCHTEGLSRCQTVPWRAFRPCVPAVT